MIFDAKQYSYLSLFISLLVVQPGTGGETDFGQTIGTNNQTLIEPLDFETETRDHFDGLPHKSDNQEDSLIEHQGFAGRALAADPAVDFVRQSNHRENRLGCHKFCRVEVQPYQLQRSPFVRSLVPL